MSIGAKSEDEIPLFIMRVNVGDGKKKAIKFWKDDDPFEKAKGFCTKFKLEEEAVEYLGKMLQKRMQESLKTFNTPNMLVSKIAFPEKPNDIAEYAPRKKIRNEYKENENTAETYDEIEDDAELHGSQTLKFQSMVVEKMKEKEQTVEEDEISEIDEKELLINAGHKMHMKGIKRKEREIKRVHKKRKLEKKDKEKKYTFKPKLNANSRKIVKVSDFLSIFMFFSFLGILLRSVWQRGI